MSIADVLERWPQTAAVFHAHNMACVGCAVAPYFSIADAAAVYRLPADEFVDALQRAIDNPPPRD